MTFVNELDDAAAELSADPDDTYEVAVGIALVADRYSTDPVLGMIARSVRDTFGTWVERIHTYAQPGGSSVAEAEAAHRDIQEAVGDWTLLGRTDPAAFAARWRATVEVVDTTWLDDSGTPLTSPKDGS